MRLVFYGTPALAVPSLVRLAEEGRTPLLVVTRRDRPQGRGLRTAPSPVRAVAEARGIPVATPALASAPEEVARIASLKPDLLVLAAYGQILRPELLAIPPVGALNVHFSLLPRHRGASPIQAAILAGDSEAGVTTTWMTEGLDEGPVFASLRTPIGPDENAGQLQERLAELGARCLSETLSRIERGEMVRQAQDPERATYAAKLGREDAKLSPDQDPLSFPRRVRAFAPKPGAFLPLRGEGLQVLAASPGSRAGSAPDVATPGHILALHRERGIEMGLRKGSVWLERVRPSGRKEMPAFEYANGARLKEGAKLPLEEAPE